MGSKNLNLTRRYYLVDSKFEEQPIISIIIIDYSRPKFLKRAVDSALSQNMLRSQFEVIVVKNFEDPSIDYYLRETGVISLLPVRNNSPMTWGFAAAEGVRIARGEIICFLDDDDEFKELKLNVVYEEFKKNERLGYLHNGFELIDELGNRLDETILFDELRETLLVKTANDKSLNLLFKTKKSFGVNNSCISMRRTLLFNNIDALTEGFAIQEIVALMITISEGKEILFVPERLNLFRYSVKSDSKDIVSSKGFVDHKVKYSERAIETIQGLKETLKLPTIALNYLRGEEAYWYIAKSLYKNDRSVRIRKATTMLVRNKRISIFSIVMFLITYFVSKIVGKIVIESLFKKTIKLQTSLLKSKGNLSRRG